MNEFQYALSLGIGITTNMAPLEIQGKRKAESVLFRGRDQKSELKLVADTIVFATGQKPEDMSKIAEIVLTEKGLIKTNVNGKSSTRNIFAAGDIVNGGKMCIRDSFRRTSDERRIYHERRQRSGDFM